MVKLPIVTFIARSFGLVFACSFLAACIVNTTFPERRPLIEPYIIDNNTGGNIQAFARERRRLVEWGGRVEIHGFCNSACTVFVTMPNACVLPQAVLGFHGADGPIDAVGDAQMARYYRGQIKDLFWNDWRLRPGNSLVRLTGAEARNLDPLINLC